jgi:hypothetical protein
MQHRPLNCWDDDYELTVQRPKGETTYRVDHDTYDAARTGSRADLQLWLGDVATITVNSKTAKVFIPAELDLFFPILLAWAGLGLLLGSYLWRVRPSARCGRHRARIDRLRPRLRVAGNLVTAMAGWLLFGLFAIVFAIDHIR